MWEAQIVSWHAFEASVRTLAAEQEADGVARTRHVTPPNSVDLVDLADAVTPWHVPLHVQLRWWWRQRHSVPRTP